MSTLLRAHNAPIYAPEQLVEKMAARGIKVENGTSRLPNYIVKGYSGINKPLDFDLGYVVGVWLIYPYYDVLLGNSSLARIFGDNIELAKVQASIAVQAIHNRATYLQIGSYQQVAGIVAAIMDYDIGNASHGFIRTGFDVCDNCGMGGDNIATVHDDNLQTFHISSASAILAASGGLKVVKHGSHGPKSNQQRTGSSDFFEYVGIDTRTGPERVIQYLNGSNLSYTESIDTRYKCIHVSGQREHRISTMNAIIGPMTNPIEPTELTVKLLGCNQIVPPAVVAEAYKLLNQIGITNVARGLFVRGLIRKNNTLQTIDEVSILNAGTEMALLYRGEVTKIRITFESFGFRGPARLEELIPSRNNAKDRIEYTLRVLDLDAPDGAVNTLIANTAALIALERFDGSSELPDFKGAAIEVRSLLRDKKHEQVISKIKEINSRLNVK